MNPRTLLCALCLVAICLPGCSRWPWKHKPKVATVIAPQPISVGTITLVNEEGKFVLVDNGALAAPPVGATLQCYPAGGAKASAELVATDVRRRPFTIADIRNGAPQKGDRVVYVPPDFSRRPPGVVPVPGVPVATGQTGAARPPLPTAGEPAR